jgi:predicted nucleotidyltransferase component of viral defense system
MSTPFQSLLSRYSCQTKADYVNAIHEIIQEIALVGLSRANFFEKAAFYGGTALRILYGLDRFSEDLDFSLLTPDPHFKLHSYLLSVEEELKGFGLRVKIEHKLKHPSQIVSAFLKTNTLETFFHIDLPEQERKKIALQEQLKIKFEVDTDPPPDFDTEVKFLLSPIPSSIRSFSLPDLFAGKMHALLFREWKVRIKGRDWYDFVWFVSNRIPLHLAHLEARMRQAKNWTNPAPLTPEAFRQLLEDKIRSLSIEMAKSDILPFLRDKRKIDIWSQDFFLSLIPQISYTS